MEPGSNICENLILGLPFPVAAPQSLNANDTSSIKLGARIITSNQRNCDASSIVIYISMFHVVKILCLSPQHVGDSHSLRLTDWIWFWELIIRSPFLWSRRCWSNCRVNWTRRQERLHHLGGVTFYINSKVWASQKAPVCVLVLCKYLSLSWGDSYLVEIGNRICLYLFRSGMSSPDHSLFDIFQQLLWEDADTKQIQNSSIQTESWD